MNRETLLGSLRDQEIRIPNLPAIFDHWSCGSSAHHEALTRVVDRRLESLVNDPKKVKKLKSADFALFTCCWWPTATFEQSCTNAYLVMWLFLWDDEIDESSGSLTDAFDDAQAYRARTAEFVEQCLGLKDHHLHGADLHPFIASFEPIGQALRAAFTQVQAQRFMDEIIIFMDASETEQRSRLDGRVMDVDSYWDVRLGTSAVGVCSAVIEYITQDAIPEEIATNEAMKTIWHETNMIVSVVNDLLSLKKELYREGIDSLIPLIVATGTSAQEAVDLAAADLRKHVERFDQAADTLEAAANPVPSSWTRWFQSWSLLRYLGFPPREDAGCVGDVRDPAAGRAGDVRGSAAVKAFIRASRQNCTGNLTWSLTTPRYGLQDYVPSSEGVITVHL